MLGYNPVDPGGCSVLSMLLRCWLSTANSALALPFELLVEAESVCCELTVVAVQDRHAALTPCELAARRACKTNQCRRGQKRRLQTQTAANESFFRTSFFGLRLQPQRTAKYGKRDRIRSRNLCRKTRIPQNRPHVQLRPGFAEHTVHPDKLLT